MVRVEADAERNLLKLRFAQRVTAAAMGAALERMRASVAELAPGFRLLTDLTPLESMDPDCAPLIEQAMELCDARGVSRIIRIIPDPQKDIGFSIMSLFHYRRRVPTVTCRS